MTDVKLKDRPKQKPKEAEPIKAEKWRVMFFFKDGTHDITTRSYNTPEEAGETFLRDMIETAERVRIIASFTICKIGGIKGNFQSVENYNHHVPIPWEGKE